MRSLAGVHGPVLVRIFFWVRKCARNNCCPFVQFTLAACHRAYLRETNSWGNVFKGGSPMHRREFIAGLAAITTLSGCASSPTVSSDVTPGVNFSGYKTFSFITEAPRGANPVAVERIKQDIGSALSGK